MLYFWSGLWGRLLVIFWGRGLLGGHGGFFGAIGGIFRRWGWRGSGRRGALYLLRGRRRAVNFLGALLLEALQERADRQPQAFVRVAVIGLERGVVAVGAGGGNRVAACDVSSSRHLAGKKRTLFAERQVAAWQAEGD